MNTIRYRFSLLLLLALSMQCAMSVHAQTDDSKWFDYMDIYGGPRIGAVGSTLTKLDGDFMFGPSVGGFFEVHITPRIAACFDLNYTHEGTRNAKCSFVDDEAGTTSNISIHLLNSDYRVRYYLMRNLNVATGLHLSRILRAYGETDGKSVKIHSNMRRGNLSIPFAVEYSIGPWAVEASYYLTLRQWAKKKNDLYNIMGDARTNKVMLTLAYKIQIF